MRWWQPPVHLSIEELEEVPAALQGVHVVVMPCEPTVETAWECVRTIYERHSLPPPLEWPLVQALLQQQLLHPRQPKLTAQRCLQMHRQLEEHPLTLAEWAPQRPASGRKRASHQRSGSGKRCRSSR